MWLSFAFVFYCLGLCQARTPATVLLVLPLLLNMIFPEPSIVLLGLAESIASISGACSQPSEKGEVACPDLLHEQRPEAL